MKFGIGPFTFQQAPWDDSSFHEIYDEGIDLVQLAESVGFDSAWASEHHFADDGFSPSPVTALTAFAVATDDIELGTSIALAPFYEPLRLAEDVAVLDQIAGGRVSIGIGLGYREQEFQGYRLSRDDRVQLTIETVDLMKKAWTEEEFTFEGELLKYGPATLSPQPASEPRPRVIIGANIPKAVRRAARHADAYMPSRASDVDDVVNQYRIFRDEKAKHDNPVGGYELPVMFYGMVAEDRDTAWEKMRTGFAYFDDVHANFRTSSPDKWFKVEDSSDPLSDTISPERERELQEKAIYGSPSDIIDSIEDLRSKLSDDLHFIFRPRHPGMAYEDVAEAVQLFGDEVIPHFE